MTDADFAAWLAKEAAIPKTHYVLGIRLEQPWLVGPYLSKEAAEDAARDMIAEAATRKTPAKFYVYALNVTGPIHTQSRDDLAALDTYTAVKCASSS